MKVAARASDSPSPDAPDSPSVLCILPARIASERIPRKPLQEIAGRPLIEWSWRAASGIPGVDRVWVATDSAEVKERVEAWGGTAILTARDHASGTDRVSEVARLPEARPHEILVNYQADEPFVDPGLVGEGIRVVREGEASVATLATPVRSEEEWRSEAVVKVVRDGNGDALYFSRAALPHPRGGRPSFGREAPYLRHVGIYVFARRALERWSTLPPSPLERIERLEQLRALQAGIRIRIVVGEDSEPGVDVPEDLDRAERILEERGMSDDSRV